MARISTETIHGTMPFVQVGDELGITGRCRIVGIEEDLVDVTTIGGPSAVVPGERTFKILLLDPVFTAPRP